MSDPILIIDGIDRTSNYKVNTCRISKQLNGRATADLVLHVRGLEYMPALGNPIAIAKDGVTRFAGHISELRSKVYPGTNLKEISVRALDYTHILDRRLVSATFENRTLYAIVKSIIDNYFSGDGITYNHVENPGPTITEKLVFNYVTGTAAFQQLAQITGYQFYIDSDKDLHFSNFQDNQAPFGLTDTSDNWRDMELSTSLAGYRNRQYVRTERPINVTQVETWETDGVQTTFWAKYPIAQKPTLLVDGVEVGLGIMAKPEDLNLYDRYVKWPDGSFFYHVDSVTMNVTPPSAGLHLELRYQSLFSNVAMVEDTNEQAARAVAEGGSGIWEAIREERNLDTLEALEAVGYGELRRHCSIPTQIRFVTDQDGLEPGQFLSIQNTAYSLDDNFLIERVDYEWLSSVRGDFFRCRVQCSNSEPDTGFSGVAGMSQYLGRVSDVTRIGQPTEATIQTAHFILGETDGESGPQDVFVGEDILNPVETLQGTPFRCRARMEEAPIGADLIFDIKKNGTSIFNNPVHIAAGQTSAVSTDIAAGTTFDYDVLTIDVLQVGSTEPGKGLTIYVDYK